MAYKKENNSLSENESSNESIDTVYNSTESDSQINNPESHKIKGASQIEKIFLKNLKVEDIKELIKNITYQQIDEEIEHLKLLIKGKNYNLELSIFFIEILSNLMKRHVKLTFKFVEVVNIVLKSKKSLKYHIYCLRIIKCLQNINTCFVPLSFYLIEIMKNVLKNQLSEAPNKKSFTLDDIKIGNDNCKTSAYGKFVITEAIDLLLNHLNMVSNSLGFPELSFFVLNEMSKIKNNKLIDKKEIDTFIKTIEKQNGYISLERNKVVDWDKKNINLFEKQLKKMF